MEILFKTVRRRGWSLLASEQGLTVKAPSRQEAQTLLEEVRRSLCKTNLSIAFSWVGADEKMTVNQQSDSFSDKPKKDWIYPNADHLTVLDFIRQAHLDGWCVVIASLLADMQILYANDFLKSDRILLKPHQLMSVNNPYLWRDSMPTHERLSNLLKAESFIPGFEYQHYRTDGSLCKFQHNFYFLENYLGCPARMAISRPGDWELVRVPEAAY